MKTEKSKKLRGSVLLTVVSVMSLLIIFLSGTLVLASAANNRAHINYSSAQAGITSRAVADAAVRAIGASESYASAVASMTAGSTPLNVPVKLESSLDADGNSKTNIGSFGKIEDVTVEYAGTKSYYNETKKVWEPKDLLKFTANVTLGGVTSTTTSYVVKDPPQPSGGGGGGGAGFVTVGDAELSCQTNLYGGSYTNLPSLDKAQQIEDNGYENYCPENKFKFQNTGSLIEADSMINGTMDGGQLQHIVFPGTGTGITIWGNWIINADTASAFDYSCTHWTPGSTVKFNEIPYVYVNGKIDGSKMKFGAPSSSEPNKGAFPLNIFCSYVNCAGNDFICYADFYCMDSDKTSVIRTDNSQLYSWTSSVVNKYDGTVISGVGGNFYSKGSLEIGGNKGLDVAGDLRIEGNLKVDSGTLNVGGNLVVGGSIIANGGTIKCKGLYCDDIQGSTINNVTVNGKKAVSDGEKELKEGYTIVDNEYISARTELKDGYIEYNNVPVDVSRVSNTPYTYGSIIKDMGGWSKEMAVDKFGHEYDLWVKAVGATYYVRVDAEGNEIGEEPIDEKYSYYDEDGNLRALYEVSFKVVDFNGYELPDEETHDESSYYDPYGNRVDVAEAYFPEGYVKVDLDGNRVIPMEHVESAKSYYGADGSYVTEADAYQEIPDQVQSLASYGDDIYPKYAERDVLIGLKEIDGVDKSDTQVTKTIKQVLEEVVNPYDSSGLPPNVNEIYEMMKSDRDSYTVHSAAEAKTKATKNGKKVVTGVSSSGGVVSITTDDDVAGSPYINKSCILDWGTDSSEFSESAGRQIVIDPDGSILLVVIKNFSLGNGYNIIIDDSKNGSSVYFYVEENSTLSIAGNGGILTTSYKGIFDNKTPFQVYTKDEYKLTDGTPSLQDLGCGNPKVYVYGGANSTLNMPDFRYMTFNILSPNIVVKAGGGTGTLGDVTMYYNGRKMEGNNYMFGCCNSNTTTFPNQMNTVYIPSGSSDPPSVETPDLSHWFKVLYYDEY